MDIELQTQQNPTSSTSEEQVLQHDELTDAPAAVVESEIHSTSKWSRRCGEYLFGESASTTTERRNRY